MYTIIHRIQDATDEYPRPPARLSLEVNSFIDLDDVARYVQSNWRNYQHLIDDIAVIRTESFRTWIFTADDDDDTGASLAITPNFEPKIVTLPI